jgi:hypothetical protein
VLLQLRNWLPPRAGIPLLAVTARERSAIWHACTCDAAGTHNTDYLIWWVSCKQVHRALSGTFILFLHLVYYVLDARDLRHAGAGVQVQ